MSNASTPSIAEHGAANAVSSIDWEKEDREARHQSNVDFELVAQEDLLAHGTPSPVYPSFPARRSLDDCTRSRRAQRLMGWSVASGARGG
jgi:hypothetical protein